MESRLSTARGLPVFIVNMKAGRFLRRPGLVTHLQKAVEGRARVVPTTSFEELEDAARDAVRSLASTVVICGGDGTYLATVTALVRAAEGRPLPRLVLAKGGTVSVVARNWSGSSNLAAIARRVVERPLSLQYVARPTIAVTEANGTKRIGFTFGTGLVASFFVEYERAGAGGNRTAARITTRVFLESLYGGAYAKKILTPLPCRITADGRELDAKAFSLVLCSVLRDVGLHLLVTHRAGEEPSRPHLVASPLSPGALGPQVFRVLAGKSLVGPGNFDGLVTSFDVEFDDDSGPYVLDGDMFHARRVTVSAGPSLLVAT